MWLETDTLLGPYRILGAIGAGSMGEVYRARDERLGRTVAVKVLTRETAADDAALARFRRETRAVAALSHPNILAIYDVGEHDRIAYAVMEYLEGETLARRLDATAMPWRSAVDVGIAVADALAAAHERGVIHRDLKPSNVFLTRDGVVKVLDFGLALFDECPASGTADAPTASFGTTPGVVMGTAGYMSPEQIRGEPIDERSDLFSFGCVLHEMLTGKRLFSGSSPADIMSAILRDPPSGLDAAASSPPPALEHLVLRCLEKDPARRFQSARDLAFALRTVSTTASGTQPRARHRRDPVIESLAVLPLRNLAGDPEQDFFADGMTEALIADLSRVEGIRVISRTSAMQYRGVSRPLPEIARELNVDGIVEGSVLRAGSRVRLTVELVQAETDSNLWARSYERRLEDVLKLQSELAQAIAREVRAKVGPRTEARLASARQVDPAAYEAYLRGRYYWNRRTEEMVRRSIEYFNRAIELDPTWGLAYAGLADAYNILGFYFHLPPSEAFPRAKAAAGRALELDGTLTEAYALLGYTELYHDWAWDHAEASFRRTLEANPNSSEGHRYYANYLTARGRTDQALAEIRAACRLDPLSLINSAAAGWVLYFMREYDRALSELRKTMDLDRTFALGRLYRGWAMLLDSRVDDAITELGKAESYGGRVPVVRAYLAHAHARAGHRDVALEMLDELVELSRRSYLSPFLVALVHLGLDDADATFEWLDRACDDRAHSLVFLDVEPMFDGIRSDPRFEALRGRVGV